MMYYYEFIHDDRRRAQQVQDLNLPRYLHTKTNWDGLRDLASRIWHERDDGRVEYIKLTCHYIFEMDQVDMREFTFVKLASRSLQDARL